MINVKIVLFGFYFPAYAFLFAQNIISEVELTTLEMILWASVISFIGGIAAAYRSTNAVNDIIKSGVNTGVMGGCLAAVATWFTLEKPALAWLFIGLSGILSLGGLATIDWVVSLSKRTLGKWISTAEKNHEHNENSE